MGFSQHFPRQETFSQTRVQVGQVIPLFTNRVKMDCYTNNFPGLPCFKKLTADKVAIIPFCNYQFDAFDSWRLHESEIQVQGNQRFFFLAASRLSHGSLMWRKIKKNLWDQGTLAQSGKAPEKPQKYKYFKGQAGFQIFSSPCGIGVLTLCSSYCIAFFFVTKFVLGCRFGNTFIFLLITKAILQLN